MNKTTDYTPKVVHVSSKEGEPSTFWQGKSGRYYRTKKQAIEDDKNYAVNPADYEIKVSFLVKYKNYILAALVAAILAAAVIYFAPKIAAKMKK